MDTTELEEENWIDYIKRSTEEAIDKMDDTKIRCWIKTEKNEMENDTENRISSKWEMDGESCWMEPWTQFKIQDSHSNWETEKKMWRWCERNPARPKTLRKAKTNHGSKQQKTVENGFYLLSTAQWLQRKDLKTMRDKEGIIRADQQDTSTEWDWVKTR